MVNQQMKAMPVAVSNCTQWFFEQLPRSLSMSTVMPADAQAAANVRVDVTCMEDRSSEINTTALSEGKKVTQVKGTHVYIIKKVGNEDKIVEYAFHCSYGVL